MNHFPALLALALATSTLCAQDAAPSPGYQIPTLDLSMDTKRQVIVDREAGQYLGHPSTVLLEDGKTMLIVYPKGHGRGAIQYKRSIDGGLTWSERMPTIVSSMRREFGGSSCGRDCIRRGSR